MRNNNAWAPILAGFGLSIALLAHAQEQAPGAPISLQAHFDLEKHQQGRDFASLNFTNIAIEALV